MASLKCFVKYLGLPLVATFKLVHLVAFAMMHFMYLEGLKFQLIHFQQVFSKLFGNLNWYYVA